MMISSVFFLQWNPNGNDAAGSPRRSGAVSVFPDSGIQTEFSVRPAGIPPGAENDARSRDAYKRKIFHQSDRLFSERSFSAVLPLGIQKEIRFFAACFLFCPAFLRKEYGESSVSAAFPLSSWKRLNGTRDVERAGQSFVMRIRNSHSQVFPSGKTTGSALHRSLAAMENESRGAFHWRESQKPIVQFSDAVIVRRYPGREKTASRPRIRKFF